MTFSFWLQAVTAIAATIAAVSGDGFAWIIVAMYATTAAIRELDD